MKDNLKFPGLLNFPKFLKHIRKRKQKEYLNASLLEHDLYTQENENELIIKHPIILIRIHCMKNKINILIRILSFVAIV